MGGDVVTDIGGLMTVVGGAGGALVGVDVGGLGAIPGAIFGATPGLTAMGVGGTFSAFGNLAKDLSGGLYKDGATRFVVNFAGGKIATRIARGSGIGSFLSPQTRDFITDAYSTITEMAVSHVVDPDSPVNCRYLM